MISLKTPYSGTFTRGKTITISSKISNVRTFSRMERLAGLKKQFHQKYPLVEPLYYEEYPICWNVLTPMVERSAAVKKITSLKIQYGGTFTRGKK